MSDDRSYKLYKWRLLRVVTTYIVAVGGWCCLFELYLSAAALLSPKAVLAARQPAPLRPEGPNPLPAHGNVVLKVNWAVSTLRCPGEYCGMVAFSCMCCRYGGRLTCGGSRSGQCTLIVTPRGTGNKNTLRLSTLFELGRCFY
jgi:hypothetical protein